MQQDAPAGTRRSDLVLGFGCAVAALLIWSGWFAVTRLSVTRILAAPDIVAMRLMGGAVVLLPLLLPRLRELDARAWREGFVLSVCWGAPFALLVALGVAMTSAAHAAALTPATMPVIAGLIAWAALGEAPGRQRGIGFGVIVAGVILLDRGFVAPPGGSAVLADALLLAAAALWAAYTVRLRRSGLGTIVASALVCLWSSLIYLPIYWFAGLQRLSLAPLQEVLLQFVYQGILVGGLAILAYNMAVRLLGGRAAVVISLVPVVATLLAIPMLGERPSALEAVAIAAIAVGAMLAAAAGLRAAPAPGPKAAMHLAG